MTNAADFSAVFPILCGFLVALWLSGVPSYTDENQITPSTSK